MAQELPVEMRGRVFGGCLMSLQPPGRFRAVALRHAEAILRTLPLSQRPHMPAEAGELPHVEDDSRAFAVDALQALVRRIPLSLRQ